MNVMNCSVCGFSLTPEAAFCPKCGTPVAGTAAVPEVPVTPVTVRPTEATTITSPLWPTIIAFLLSGPLGALLTFFVWRGSRPKSKKTILTVVIVLGLDFLGFILLGPLIFLVVIGVSKEARLRVLPSPENPAATFVFPTPESGLPWSSPTANPSPAMVRFTSATEALTFALADNKVANPQNVKLDELDILTTATSKEWKFTFRDGDNLTTIRVEGDGNFSRDTSTDTANGEPSFWSKMPLPAMVASESFIEQARQKMTAGGFTPSLTTVSAKYTTCTYCTDYKEKWTIYLPFAGVEKTSGTMDAKQIVFQDGAYTSMNDGTLSIY
jgi:hypothetical protein